MKYDKLSFRMDYKWIIINLFEHLFYYEYSCIKVLFFERLQMHIKY